MFLALFIVWHAKWKENLSPEPHHFINHLIKAFFFVFWNKQKNNNFNQQKKNENVFIEAYKKSMHLFVYIFTENLTVFLLYIVGMIGVCAV